MSTLYIVATPIGNLADITLRALKILKSVDLIACEDTRQTKKLLDRYQIQKPLISYHQHSKLQKIDYLIEQLKTGKNIALVTDAGTPGILDPGGKLVAEAVKVGGVKIIPIPGPAALTTAASIAGIPLDKFLFLGFLPHKKGRETLIKKIISSEYPVIFYESVHRILKTLEQLKNFGLNREIVVCRELTKIFETVYRGRAEKVLEEIKQDKVKGEFVVIISKT